MPTNEFGQPVGDTVPAWTARLPVSPVALSGRTCTVAPVGRQHLASLHAALDVESPPGTWTYLPQGPFPTPEELWGWIETLLAAPATEPFAIVVPDDRALGVASYLPIDPANGSAEVGAIVTSAALARTTASTEAVFLLLRHVFDLGYRRCEWKCDSMNEPSRRAANRYGFSYEGTFRNALVVRGRNRDTTWYSLTDAEWDRVRPEFERWLDPGNFDDHGRQLTRLDTASALGQAPAKAAQDR